jgi:hypothetical protein
MLSRIRAAAKRSLDIFDAVRLKDKGSILGKKNENAH